MPAFTYIATIIVAEIGGIALAAAVGSAGLAFITSAVAVGLAYVTSRLINGAGGGSGGTSQDPGVRIQFPPATNNKVPIVYGSANTKGIITDARLSNENKTMTYVLVISEKTQTGTFSVGDVYWNDQKLVFDTTAGSEHIVRSSIDQNGAGSSNTNFDGLIRCRIYSGSVDAANQIFPLPGTGNTANARTALGESDSNYLLNDLVFAVIQVDYNSQKGTTGLGQITFQINNTLKNPGDVWLDYMTATRYGAGYSVAQINTSTCIGSTSTSLKSISNQIPANQFQSDGTTPSTQSRYEINGVLSTGDTVKNNLDRICLSCASWTTFDYTEGLWRVIPNRAATGGELAQAFEFTDDNIIGEVGITATNLEDLFNLLEVEYASRVIRDQNDYYRGAIDPTERNDLEPDNTLSMRLEMCNNALHSSRIGLIELKQSRIDKIITFRADYSAIQCSAGDVVKVTNSVYDFNEKLFRITKLREIEDDAGGILVEITALEYDEDIYTDETLLDNASVAGSGIPVFGGSAQLPSPSTPTITNINTTTPSFTLNTTISPTSGPINEIQWFYSGNSSTGFVYLTNEVNSSGNFGAGSTVTDVISLVAGTYYFRARAGQNFRYSDLSSTSSGIVWDPAAPSDYGIIP